MLEGVGIREVKDVVDTIRGSFFVIKAEH